MRIAHGIGIGYGGFAPGPTSLEQTDSGFILFDGFPDSVGTDINGVRSWVVNAGAAKLLRADTTWPGHLDPTQALCLFKVLTYTISQGIMVSGMVKGQFQGVFAGQASDSFDWPAVGNAGYAVRQRDNFNRYETLRAQGTLIASGGPDPGNAWSALRMVVSGNDTSKTIITLTLEAQGQAQFDAATDLVEAYSFADSSPALDSVFTEAGVYTSGGAADKQLGDVHICKGKTITVTGLGSGQKIQVDSRTAIEEVDGTVTIDVKIWAVNANGFLGDAIKLLSPADAELDSITPANGVNGGDTYAAS